MMKPVVFGDNAERGLIKDFPLQDVDPSFEPTLKFKTHWVQDHRNHRALLDCFWNHVREEESLVFFYAKQVPLVEDSGRRVLVGAGRVLKILGLTEYEYDGSPNGKVRSLLWERMVVHSIRCDFTDGFLLPYQEALEKSDEGRAFDPAEVVAFAPEDRFNEFSFATEHVGSDTAISALLSCRVALLRAAERMNISIKAQETWIDHQLGRLWKRRGAFPGMGAVLSATGVPMGNFVAQALLDKVGEDGDVWQGWRAALEPSARILPDELSQHLDDAIRKSWLRMDPQRLNFLQLLSRIDLTHEQASLLAIPEERREAGVNLEDSSFVKNPYLIYETTRLGETPVALGAVDRGVFPSTFIRKRFPLRGEANVRTPFDARRVRALVIRELEDAAINGDCLRARSDLVASLRRREESVEEERTELSADLLAVAETDTFSGEIVVTPMSDGSPAYQLQRLAKAAELIRDTVRKRVNAKRHELNVNWRNELDAMLKPPVGDKEELEKEERARHEKSAALAEVAAARFSILIGPAGTGKTTLLSVLCHHEAVQKDGVLLLAPTGKARVRMEDVAKKAGVSNYEALTVAQFLSRSEPPRYDGRIQRYQMTGMPGEKCARTVIVDECSMLTEEMMAAVIEGLSGVHRLIFVGDPRQLPPIGPGRPFADIVAELQPGDLEKAFPRVGKGYAELTVPRRQGAGERDDLQLAAWFGGGVSGPGEDQVFDILSGRRESSTVQFVHWETPSDLESKMPPVIAQALGFDAELEEWQAFACSLGATLDERGSAWFNKKYQDYAGSGQAAEAWQVLSPVRQKPWGVETLNRFVHERYKGHQVKHARKQKYPKSIPEPRGDQQIIYGDKVINVRNWTVWPNRMFPKPEAKGYLANGEIGMVVGHRRTKKKPWEPENLEVEFSTQLGTAFTFYKSDFPDDGDVKLELAYALTVHKAQGSEFNVVFLVLPKSPLMLTRELLYTALTRQKEKVVIFHQGSVTDLQRLSSERHSATARRLTNVFGAPKRVAVGDTFLEERLIHLTSRGEAVRSKSEVIIANLLHAKGIHYHYEHPLELDGLTKYPDFTIEDDDTGFTYYWEHCGLLHDLAYLKRWEDKQRWYRAHKILPLEEGGGEAGTLIATRDQADGGIDSKYIAGLLQTVFRR